MNKHAAIFPTSIYRLALLCMFFLSLWLPISCATTSKNEEIDVIKKGQAAKMVGEAYLTQKNYTGALREFHKALKYIPDDPYLQNYLGLTYQGKDRLDLAIEHFQRAVSLKPDLTPAVNNLGGAYLADQQYDKAIEVLTTITDDLLYATPHYPYSLIGRAYFHKNDYSNAVDSFQKALKYEPDYVFALNWLGRSYMMLDENDAAIEQFRKSIKVAPKFIETYFDLAIAYQRTERYDSAREAYKIIEGLAPVGSNLKKEAIKRSSELPNS